MRSKTIVAVKGNQIFAPVIANRLTYKALKIQPCVCICRV